MKTSLKILGIVLVIVGALCIPIEKVTIVPAWRLRVQSSSGSPVSAEPMRQAWMDYSLEFWRLGEHFEDAVTDSNGYVEFPAREISVSPMHRILAGLRDTISGANPHASYGPFSYITCVKRYGCRAFYEGKGALPEEIIVP